MRVTRWIEEGKDMNKIRERCRQLDEADKIGFVQELRAEGARLDYKEERAAAQWIEIGGEA